MSKALLLNIRDAVLGLCLGATLFLAGYVVGAIYPPSRPVPTSFPVHHLPEQDLGVRV
jgi:hypothetical protein